MARPRANRLSDLECDELMRAVQACRSACVLALSKAPIDAEGVAVVRELMAVMDRLAEALQGDRERFWTRLHSTPKRG